MAQEGGTFGCTNFWLEFLMRVNWNEVCVSEWVAKIVITSPSLWTTKNFSWWTNEVLQLLHQKALRTVKIPVRCALQLFGVSDIYSMLKSCAYNGNINLRSSHDSKPSDAAFGRTYASQHIVSTRLNEVVWCQKQRCELVVSQLRYVEE